MKSRTRHFMLNVATGVAIAATAAVVLMPVAASAAPATATASVNVRAEPSGTAPIVNRLDAGENVDVRECQGTWCYVVASGQDGWVSSRYLGGVSSDPNVQFGFSIGPGGPSVSIGVGTPEVVEEDEDEDVGIGEVCFFEDSRYRGDSFCSDEGTEISNLREWAGEISSIENPDGLEVTVCSRTRFRGECRTYTTNARTLGSLNDEIFSLSIE